VRQYAQSGSRSVPKLEAEVAKLRMSREGNCYDNAPLESFRGSLKNELVHHHRYATRADAQTAIQEYIESFYNRQRRHSRSAMFRLHCSLKISANSHRRPERRVSAIDSIATAPANATDQYTAIAAKQV